MRFSSRTARLVQRTDVPIEDRVVMALSGACVLVRSGWRFDESYSHAMEDVELGLRIRESGGESVLVPSARCWHEGGGTLQRDSPRATREAVKGHLRLVGRSPSSVFWCFLMPSPRFSKRARASGGCMLSGTVGEKPNATGILSLTSLGRGALIGAYAIFLCTVGRVLVCRLHADPDPLPTHLLVAGANKQIERSSEPALYQMLYDYAFLPEIQHAEQRVRILLWLQRINLGDYQLAGLQER